MLQGHKFSRSFASAYLGEQILVTHGVNQGEGFSVSRDLCLGDAYEIKATVLPVPMHLTSFKRSNAKPGELVFDCQLTLMSETGHHISAELYAALDTQGCVQNTHLRTDKQLTPKTPYVLIDIQG